MGAFGEKLRKEREQQGISLDAISNATKISVRMLRALEEEHFEQLPGGVFNKGFVRAYARHVGLDEEEAVAEYLDALRESQLRQQAIMPDLRSTPETTSSTSERLAQSCRQPAAFTDQAGSTHRAGHAVSNRQPVLSIAEGRSTSSAGEVELEAESAIRTISFGADNGEPDQGSSTHIPSQSIPWMKLVLALALVVVGLALWNFIRRHKSTANGQIQPGQQQSASASSAARPLGSATPGLPNQTSPVLSVGASQKLAINARAKNQTISSASTNAAVGRSVTDTALGPIVPANTTMLTSKKGASVAQPDAFTLFIRAEKTTWVSIVADGKQVTEETLIAPAHTSVRASKEIVVRAGNAAGIIFELNGKQVGEPGADGEVRTYVFDANGIEPAEHSAPTNP